LLYKQRVRDEDPVRQNAVAFWTHAVRPGGVRIALRRFESIPPSPPVKQKWVPTGPVLLYKQRVRDENPVRQNAVAFWTHAVRPGGVRIALRRFESIPPSPPNTSGCIPVTWVTDYTGDIGNTFGRTQCARRASVAFMPGCR